MIMKCFKIIGEKRTAAYQLPAEKGKRTHSRAGAYIAAGIALSLASILSSNIASPSEKSDPYTKTGIAVYYPEILNIHKVQELARVFLKKNLSLKMKMDVKLSLTNKNNIIEFIADGYDPVNKVAFEWIAAPGYSTNNSEQILTAGEIQKFSSYQFDSTFIIILDKKDKDGILNDLSKFKNYYQKIK